MRGSGPRRAICGLKKTGWDVTNANGHVFLEVGIEVEGYSATGVGEDQAAGSNGAPGTTLPPARRALREGDPDL